MDKAGAQPGIAAPVALFVFNRPEHTRQVAKAIRLAAPSRLLVVADGPRLGNERDVELCIETRDVIGSIDWQCEVLTAYSDVNLGCKERVASGIGWVFSECPEAIILEDDCVPDPTFFRFCDELLVRFRDVEQVWMVSGTSDHRRRPRRHESYSFSRGFKIWGWASWARAWAHYDVEMAEWPQLRDAGWLENYLHWPRMSAVTRRLFDEAHAGRVPTWDYQWAFAGWRHDGLAISPATNLVRNIGHGPDGSHLTDPSHPLADRALEPMRFPLVHPRRIVLDEESDAREWRLAFPQAFADESRLEAMRERVRRFVRHTRARVKAAELPAPPDPREVVYGAAVGYSAEHIRPFVASLRSTGYDGAIVLLAERRRVRALRAMAEFAGVEVVATPQWPPRRWPSIDQVPWRRRCWAASHRALWALRRVLPSVVLRLHPVSETRFLVYLDHLRRHDYESVLVADVRDVLFQANPFEALPGSGLAASIEPDRYTIASEPWNERMVRLLYGDRVLAEIGGRPVSCSGVTYGDRASMLRYLDLMATEIGALSRTNALRGWFDQALHNRVLWSRMAGEWTPLATLSSAVATLGAVPEQEVPTDEGGAVVNEDGSPVAILHQYDRLPTLGPLLAARLGGSSPA